MVIWKFILQKEDLFDLEMPKGAEILTVQNQKEIPCMWALVDPDAEKEKRTFALYATGDTYEYREYKKYIGTFQLFDGSLVFHLFEFNP